MEKTCYCDNNKQALGSVPNLSQSFVHQSFSDDIILAILKVESSQEKEAVLWKHHSQQIKVKDCFNEEQRESCIVALIYFNKEKHVCFLSLLNEPLCSPPHSQFFHWTFSFLFLSKLLGLQQVTINNFCPSYQSVNIRKLCWNVWPIHNIANICQWRAWDWS